MTTPTDTPIIDVDSKDITVQADREGYAIDLGDGLRVRITAAGTIGVRAKHHTMQVMWLTNKPVHGEQSVARLVLERKPLAP